MKKPYTMTIAAIATSCIICVVFARTEISGITAHADKHPQKTVKRIGYHELAPLIQANHQQPAGICADFLRSIAQAENWEIEWRPMDSLPCSLQALADNEIDIAAAVPYTEGKPSSVKFTRESFISTWGQIYISPASEFHGVQSFTDLNNAVIGVVQNDHYGAELRQLTARLGITCRFIEYKNYVDLLTALHNGWMDAGIVDRMYGATHAQNYNIMHSSAILAPTEIRFAVNSQAPPKLINILDYHLRAQKNNQQSELNRAIQDIINHKTLPKFYRYLWWGLCGTLVLLLLAGSFCILLKSQIRRKTSELKVSNATLIESNELLELRPDLPVILCSGYHDTVIDETKRGNIRVLNKPFRHHEITKVIQSALANQHN